MLFLDMSKDVKNYMIGSYKNMCLIDIIDDFQNSIQCKYHGRQLEYNLKHIIVNELIKRVKYYSFDIKEFIILNNHVYLFSVYKNIANKNSIILRFYYDSFDILLEEFWPNLELSYKKYYCKV